MKSFFKSFFAALFAILFVILVLVCVIAVKSSESPKIEDHSYLIIDVAGDIPEYSPAVGIMGEMMGGGGGEESLTRILGNLEKAAVDDRIEGVVLSIGGNNLGYAKIEEIRNAVKAVQKAGKPVYGYAEMLNRKKLILAGVCDSIFIPPPGGMEIMGMAAVSQHLKGTLEKLGIKPNLHKIKDYKAAAEMLIREDMSAASKENRAWILDETWALMVNVFEEDRGISEEKILELMNLAMFTADETLAMGVVDEILYWDQLMDRLKCEDEDEARTVSQGDYRQVEREKLDLTGKKKIAVIHAQGTIAGRQNGFNPVFGVMMGHESVSEELNRARLDEDVVAVVFRIDSGGGESLASNYISRTVERVKMDKPIVASMVDVAASGGYCIAYKANKIMADPSTRTGSIGSISMKFNMRELNEKLGISFDSITRGPNALMWSSITDFSDEQRELFEANHDRDFEIWLADVAEKRGMTFDEARLLADGRLWTGRQAKENGLIDELGGMTEAIALAKELADIPADEQVTVVHYPEEKDFIEQLISGEGGIQALARQAVYRLLRKDLQETYRLATSPMYLAEPIDIN
jgi:protease IV